MTEEVAAVSTAPSDIIKARASKIDYDEDMLGRKIGVRWLGPMGRVALARIVGNADMGNEEVANHFTAAYAVCAIDGVVYAPPQNLAEIEMMLQRLDDEGVICAMRMLMMQRVSMLNSKKPEDAAKEANESLKNS
jgi:hypothetical protein